MKSDSAFLFAYAASLCGVFAPLVAAEDQVAALDAERLALVKASQDRDRAVWFPAVQQLGQVVREQPDLRREIWARARVNTIGMKFAPIMPGEFWMGPDWFNVFRGPMQSAHSVRLSRPFYFSTTEVTNEQFQAVIPEYAPDAKYSRSVDSPAVRISYDDTVRFCERLSASEGVRYRLPTEAEWEFACRAGSTTKFSFGDDVSRLGEYACWNETARGAACPVATFAPNDWGIYDMQGNVVEWVEDWFSLMYYLECYHKGVVDDPKGPSVGLWHGLRGAPWSAAVPDALACTYRMRGPMNDRALFDAALSPPLSSVTGFRVVREAGE